MVRVCSNEFDRAASVASVSAPEGRVQCYCKPGWRAVCVQLELLQSLAVVHRRSICKHVTHVTGTVTGVASAAVVVVVIYHCCRCIVVIVKRIGPATLAHHVSHSAVFPLKTAHNDCLYASACACS